MKDMKLISETLEIIKSLNTKTKFSIKKNVQSLGITRQSFYNKFKDLKEQKIINNYTINIHPQLSPINRKYVMLEIKTNPTEPSLVEELTKIPQLRMLDGIFGEYSLFALFIFKSLKDYYEILNTIDKIMAGSYFKKYHLIETIKVYKTNGIELKSKNNASLLDLDDIDNNILEILQIHQKDKPISTYEIREVLIRDFQEDISQSTVHNRIKRLEQADVILNYSINFSPIKIGFEGKYLLRIKPKDPSKYDDLALSLINNHYITDLFRIGEEYGLFAIVRVKKIGDYGSLIKDLYDTEEVEDTFTNFILDELKTYTNFILF
jgi:DNA-binding Lrp family transcriptional regulator